MGPPTHPVDYHCTCWGQFFHLFLQGRFGGISIPGRNLSMPGSRWIWIAASEGTRAGWIAEGSEHPMGPGCFRQLVFQPPSSIPRRRCKVLLDFLMGRSGHVIRYI